MSFSSDVKEELSRKTPKTRHCKLAFLAGLSLESTDTDVSRMCCKRAYLKGAFIASGTLSDPNKAYHFEIVSPSKTYADWLAALIRSLGVDGKVSKRKESYIVYVKDGSGISDLLNLMEAHVSMMNFENVRIVKEVRNSVNRQVNCEVANSSKTIAAAKRQIDDIKYIQENAGFDKLKPELAQMARLRLENPDVSLKDLGMMFDEPVGKSGVNHRLAKLCEIAESLRKQNSINELSHGTKEELK